MRKLCACHCILGHDMPCSPVFGAQALYGLNRELSQIVIHDDTGCDHKDEPRRSKKPGVPQT